jgi:quercetin dioxygenase-like cupin family protein
MKAYRVLAATAAILVVAGSAIYHPAALAQQAAGIGRTEALRHDLDEPGREIRQVRVDFAPGAFAPEHRHPGGVEVAHVLEGTLEYRLAGGPPITLQAGQSLFIPAGTVHSARNVGTGPAAELATYVVDKSQPLVAAP